LQTVTKSKEEQSSGKKSTASSPFFKFRVSTLSHYCFCAKRCKLETFQKFSFYNQSDYCFNPSSISRGNRMHYQYSYPLKSFDRQLFLSQLPEVLQGQVDNIIVRGKLDDVRVLFNPDSQERFVSIIELKTTSKPRMWNVEIESAIFQLQLYIWLVKKLMRPCWKLHKRHYLEIYSQRTGQLMKRIPVEEDPNIEDKIRYIVRAFQGLEKVQFPHRSTCRLCPKFIRSNCDWYGNN
jgi:CRISPR/Cas system-associated exonuclease Cas4 (RecB family)